MTAPSSGMCRCLGARVLSQAAAEAIRLQTLRFWGLDLETSVSQRARSVTASVTAGSLTETTAGPGPDVVLWIQRERRSDMRTERRRPFVTGARLALTTVFALAAGTACEPPDGTVTIDDDDIGGVVTGPNGPEAGVWVIAETTDLPTRFVRIVVTDDEGRYLIPDLPSASYGVWVRGYGLVDSEKLQASPGQVLDHTAVVASDAMTVTEMRVVSPRPVCGSTMCE